MSDLIDQLKIFIKRSREGLGARAWIEDGGLRIYLRKELRRNHGICLTVGDAEFPQERFEDFIQFVKILHGRNPYDSTAVDTVFFQETFERLTGLGWRRQENSHDTGGMFRSCHKEAKEIFVGCLGKPTGP
jgi:hypothetical protein